MCVASRKSVLLVFVIPVIVSISLAGAVMAQILNNPSSGSVEASDYMTIVGLESTYAAPASIKTYVHVTHNSFDCGNLNILIRLQGTQSPILQSGFRDQCFAKTNTMIPIGNGFTAQVLEPGTYELVASIQDVQKRNLSTVTEVFTVN